MDRAGTLTLAIALLSLATASFAAMLVIWVMLNQENDWRLFLFPVVAFYGAGIPLLLRGLRMP